MLGIGTRDIVPPLGEGELERKERLEVGWSKQGKTLRALAGTKSV